MKSKSRGMYLSPSFLWKSQCPAFNNIHTIGRKLEFRIHGEPGLLDVSDLIIYNVDFCQLSCHNVRELHIY